MIVILCEGLEAVDELDTLTSNLLPRQLTAALRLTGSIVKIAAICDSNEKG